MVEICSTCGSTSAQKFDLIIRLWNVYRHFPQNSNVRGELAEREGERWGERGSEERYEGINWKKNLVMKSLNIE